MRSKSSKETPVLIWIKCASLRAARGWLASAPNRFARWGLERGMSLRDNIAATHLQEGLRRRMRWRKPAQLLRNYVITIFHACLKYGSPLQNLLNISDILLLVMQIIRGIYKLGKAKIINPHRHIIARPIILGVH